MIRNVIFDWSGTLVDDLLAVWKATNYVFARAGVPALSLDQFRAEFCLPFEGFYERFTPHVPLPELEVWFHDFFRDWHDSIPELPHAREFLKFCRERGLKTFLLTTVPEQHYAIQAARNGFHEYLDHTYLGVRDKRAKIHEILETHQLQPAETVFIGDMQHDVETAKHGGIHSCAVLTGYNRADQLRASEPDLIVEHLGELGEILRQNALELRRSGNGEANSARRRPVVTVGALICNHAGEVLMVRTRKWSNLWGIPGGKVKYGEPSVEALKRELKEETGLDIANVEFVMVQDCINSREFYRDEHFILLNYTCRCADASEVRLNNEAQEYRWVTTAGALRMNLNTPTRLLLETVASQPKEKGR